jgi:broad specificity phosphatase PhoE
LRIGLARHFQIPHRKRAFLDADGYREWIRWYDGSHGPQTLVPDSGVDWRRCYSSDLVRARITAEILFTGPIEITPLLREVPFAPLFRSRVPLPLFLWETLSRAGWLWEHASQPETRLATRMRAAGFLDHVLRSHPGEDVLIVSHGFLMQCLQGELLRAGFRGRVPIHPKGGHVHVFESSPLSASAGALNPSAEAAASGNA